MKVRSALKHLFIPHHGNDFKPHFFREAAVGSMLLVSVFLLGMSFGSSRFLHRTVLGATIASSVLIDLTNESRVLEHEVPLLKNEKLSHAAQLKGEDMVTKEYFSHNSPDGVTPWHWFKLAGYSFLYAGENLAINFTHAEAVENAWLNSPKHRANILNGEFREIGIATVPGVYEGVPTIYIVQMFGTPAYSETANAVESTVKVVKKSPIVTTTATTSVVASSTIDMKDVLSGNVKGESVDTNAVLENVGVTGDMVVVKNTTATEMTEVEKLTFPTYATWYDTVLFFWSHYVDVIYKTLVGIIALALLVMIVVEIRRQHIRHIFYGVSLLLLLQLFIYINQSFF